MNAPPLIHDLLRAANLALQDAGPDADDPSRHVWIVNDALGGPMVSVGTSPEEAAHAALRRLRSHADALAAGIGWTLWDERIAPTPLRRRRRR
jgi:hypothetical protein